MLLKNIKDIEIANGDWSITREKIISLDSIIKDIETLPYSGENRFIDENVENARLPFFATVFYYLMFQRKSIPSEDAFFEEYLKTIDTRKSNPETFMHQGKELSKEGLKMRVLRTYPSLIRDVHFYYYLLESRKFQNVNYSLKRDIFDGIDIQVEFEDIKYGISIHIGTFRGSTFKKKKESRHDYSTFREIVIVAKFDQLINVGKFYLLGELELQEILTKIEEADFVEFR